VKIRTLERKSAKASAIGLGKKFILMASPPLLARAGSPDQLSSGERDLDPSWSRDGNTVMFGVFPDNPESAEIMLVDLKTRAVPRQKSVGAEINSLSSSHKFSSVPKICYD
jgi:hypothetical protein